MSSMFIKGDIILDLSKVDMITVKDECKLKGTYFYQIVFKSGVTMSYVGTELFTEYKKYINEIEMEKTISEEK